MRELTDEERRSIREFTAGMMRKEEIDPSIVPISGKVVGQEEMQNLIECAFESWWTDGKWCAEFERRLGGFLGIPHVLSVNSGSSANLIALKALTSIKLGKRRIRKGDEVITVAAGFPTTVNPIIEIGAIPVFIDVDVYTYNATIDSVRQAITQKTRAIILAHTLGNPFDAEEMLKLCQEHSLYLIEDNCDALGSTLNGKHTGTFGHFATHSFYPAHHITTAEGGAIVTGDETLYKIARSLRDWGRDCWCPTGKDNCCGKRFDWKLGALPKGFDHKYTYSEIGYNLKMTDFSGAIGTAQVARLPGFTAKRQANFKYLYSRLEGMSDRFILPRSIPGASPSWFGFPLTIKDPRIDRTELLRHLQKRKIGTRLLFCGNITKQPYFIDHDIPHRIIGDLKNTDTIMEKTFWVGTYPGLTKDQLSRISSAIKEFIG